jgi:type II secretory pathway pseudopilin PulG
MRVENKERHGDTLIEVMMAISIFSFVAMLSINMMNDGINTAQRTLESEMARNEIDAQAEALRFIHNNYVAEREKSADSSQFRSIWNTITGMASKPSKITNKKSDDANDDGGKSFDINDMDSCEAAYGANKHLDKYRSFILNTRLIVPNLREGSSSSFTYLGTKYENLKSHIIVDAKSNMGDNSVFHATPLYPRIIYKELGGSSSSNNSKGSLDEDQKLYTDILSAEGIWIDAAGSSETKPGNSDYYDFYIRTCWQAAGTMTQSTITTVVRLYNPEVME